MQTRNESRLWQALLCFSLAVFAGAGASASADDYDREEGGLNENSEFVSRVASKRLEKTSEAPAIVSVVTEDEIKQFGAISLVDLLNRIANVYVMSTYAYPDNMISIRGDATDQYNTRVQFALDGRAIRESMFLGDNRSIIQMFPISAIKRVEVLRGPGSVLYGGASAFVAVINIVTKGWEKDEVGGTLTYGSNVRRQGDARLAKKVGDLEFSGDVNYVADNGWDFTMTDERNYSRNTKMSQNGFGVNGNFKLNGWKAVVMYTEDDQGTIGNTPIWGPDRLPSYISSRAFREWDYKTYSQRLFLDLDYEHKFTESWKLVSTMQYQAYNFHFQYPDAKDISRESSSKDFSYALSTNVKAMENLQVSGGFLFWRRGGGGTEPAFTPSGSAADIYSSTATANSSPYQFIPNTVENFYSAFALVDYKPIEALLISAGTRMNKPPGTDVNFVPQVGAVYTFNQEWTAKLLFGQTFRAASISERFRQSSSATGNPTLRPETATTYEAQVNYTLPHLLLSATYFEMLGSDLITRSAPDSSGRQYYINSTAGSTSRGVELEGKVSSAGWTGNYGITYTRVNIGNNYQVYGTPSLLAKVGLAYDFGNGIGLGVFDQWVGPSAQPVTSAKNPSADAYNWMTANARFALNEFFHLGKNELVVNFYAQNLLDADVYFVEYVRQNLNTIPGRAGRTYYASLSYYF